MKQLYFLVAFAILLSNCSTSLTYSPSLNLPNKPLEKGAVELQGSAELFPESRPEKVDNNVTFGLNGKLGYAFSDNFGVSVNGWLDAGNGSLDSRLGLAVNAQFIKHRSPTSRFIILPRFGFVNFGEGYGLSNSVIYHKEASEKLSWYSGLGVAWGYSQLSKISLSSFEPPRYPFGYLAMGHLGMGYSLNSSIRVNLELNPIYQVNPVDNQNHFFVAPSLGLGLVLNQKEKS